MDSLAWCAADDAGTRLAVLGAGAEQAGTTLVVAFEGSGRGGPLPWPVLQRWIASRAVTVADIRCELACPGLEVALACDLVILREGGRLELPSASREPPPALTWAAGRAGRAALARVLLCDGPIGCEEALDLGLVHAVLPAGEEPPLGDGLSGAAATAVRDLLRASGRGAEGALELATFRLMFATGDPAEGAQAFLERRLPRFAGRRPAPGA